MMMMMIMISDKEEEEEDCGFHQGWWKSQHNSLDLHKLHG